MPDSVCELCNAEIPDSDARFWLICMACRRKLGSRWRKLRRYCLDPEEFSHHQHLWLAEEGRRGGRSFSFGCWHSKKTK